MSNEASVFTGVWTNWENGRLFGLMLTLSGRNGAFLIAFLALFVRFTGNQIWKIFCYVSFQIRSKKDDQDGFYHQQQVILRNNNSDVGDLWRLAKISWFWRSNTRSPVRRTLILAACAVTHIIVFAVAGIFSSRVARSQSLVLVRSAYCGPWKHTGNSEQMPTPSEIELLVGLTSNQLINLIQSNTYARACYKDTPSQDQCQRYIKDRIAWVNTTSTSCPFNDIMCINNTVLELDTGYTNSHLDLGINSHPEDRILYRRVMTCAPVKTDGFVDGPILRTANDTLGWFPITPGEADWAFSYGHSIMSNFSATYEYRNASFSSSAGYNSQLAPYVLDAEISGPSSGTFYAIPFLNRTDADVTLIFLASDLAYAKPVDDPIFSAHGDPAAIYGGPVLYLTDNDPPVSVLGCAEQHQFCKLDGSGKPTCVPPTGLDGATASDVELALTPRQGAIFRRIYDCVSENILSAVIAQLGANSLLATLSVGGGASVGLPPYQWQLEMENWLAIMMSNIQLETVQYATGPSDPQFLKHVNTTAGGFGSTSDGTWMCDNQIMQDNSYICFSVLGLVLILCIGGLFSIVGLVIDGIVGFVQKYAGRSNYRLLEWIADETLQLQRSAYQANGLGTWSSTTDSVPITALGDRFGLPSKKADLET